MSNEEHASGQRRSPFPDEWGRPEGRPDSEERAAWVRRNVERHFGMAALRKLHAANGRLLSNLRVAEIMRREKGPE